MAGLDDHTTARVSGGVIYGEMCALLGVCESVCGHKGPSLPPLSNHRVDLWTPRRGCESPTAR